MEKTATCLSEFLLCRDGQNEPLETVENGEMWGNGGWEGDLKLLQGKQSSYAAWQWSDFHLHRSPGGDKPVVEGSPEANCAGAPAGLREPPQAGTGTETA